MRADDAATLLETLALEITEGAARVIAPSLPREGVTTFGLHADADTSATAKLECWHRMVVGSGRTLDEAVEEFRQQAAFPFPSLMPRITVAWRRMPMIAHDRDFASDTTRVRITARYVLILDMPDDHATDRI